MKKKVSIVTLGCQMNRHDSEWVNGLLEGSYELTDDTDVCDLLILNTCAVRDKAEHKFFSMMGRIRPIKHKNKKMVIAVGGCIAQEMGEKMVKREPLIDIVFGTKAIDRLPELIERFIETGRSQVDTADGGEFENYPMIRQSQVSAWVSIMRGCDNHCSYCIVPTTRGGEESRNLSSILEEVRSLKDEGYKEITLLGQNVNSYGKGLDGGIDFPSLLEKIDSIGIPRIRFMTSHPKDLSDDLICVMSGSKNICPALHLPLQSGSDKILAEMNRAYTVGHYFDRIEKLRKVIPDISLTTDMIVGFPGETDKDFEASLLAVKKAECDNIFLFKYSPRPGTVAESFEINIPEEELTRRFDTLYALQNQIGEKRRKRFVGRLEEILVESRAKGDDKNSWVGRNPNNMLTKFSSDNDFIGSVVSVRIIQSKRFSLVGEPAFDTADVI